MKELLMLVDRHDRRKGSASKLEAHQKGQLHRAFSIFIFDSADRLPLQQRAFGKYHSHKHPLKPVTDRRGRAVPYHIIQGPKVSRYESKVIYTYQDDPEDWRKAIGDRLMFQFGVYDDPRSQPLISLDESG
ncbi:hypothetical protein SAMN04490186_3226 [Pseudomonas grimontii]|uniref:Transposase n=1 Tax=Pseudomonas grimontii TaxID=129847 RepID=A0ABY0TM98_9PSED|nr:hypothetical protein [Pseudomonas grimontii]SDR07573.1 hypothetical protein SAMN04490186_3226 [Pseudomonas grimontii]